MSAPLASAERAPGTVDLRDILADPLGSPPWGGTLADTIAFLERYGARRPVSIVVPIFNGAEHVKRCLDSLANTLHADEEIVLVDDHSTDPSIAVLCDAFARGRAAMKLVQNPQNYGYVVSVNEGIRAARPENDIVLLNSDTVVAPGWLAKLQLASSARPKVASVSPLSNAAGVFSVPKAYEDGALPEGLSVELASRLLSLASPRRYEEVPVSCGFCMYLRREALSEIGLFDDRIFHRGYGEENDWCERARAAGFVHVVDESCFVAHFHGASFQSEKARLKRRNGSLVKALYPEHVAETTRWLANSRLEEVRAAFRYLWASEGTAERASAFPSPTHLVLQSEAGPLHATPGGIVVQVEADRCHIDLSGLARSSHELTMAAELTRIVAQLLVRWTVQSVDVVTPSLREHLDARLAAFGIASLGSAAPTQS